MRRGTVLLCLTLTVAVLCGCLALLRGPAPDAQEAPSPTEAAPYRMLYEKSLADFLSLRVTLLSGESYSVSTAMVYDAGGALLGVTSSLAQPVTVDGREDFALSATSYQMMLLAAQHLPVTASYDALDPEACGLVSPDARLEISYRDGSAIALSLGHLTASGLSCYVQMEGDSAVHLVPYDFHQVMTQPLASHHRLPGALAASPSNAAQVALDGTEDGRIIATKHPGEGLLLPWQVDMPLRHSGSTERVEALIEGVCAIHAEAYVTTVYDMTGLARYGLDAPLRLVVSFQDGTLRDIHIGSDAGDGQVYVRMDTTGDVYRLSREQLTFLDQSGLNSLLDHYVALIPVNRLSQVTVATSGKESVLSLLWANTDSAEPDGYLENGASLPRQDFSTRYAALVGVQFDQTAPAEATRGALIAQLCFETRDGSTETVSYYESTHHYNLVETSSGGRFLVRRERVDAMLSAQEGGS